MNNVLSNDSRITMIKKVLPIFISLIMLLITISAMTVTVSANDDVNPYDTRRALFCYQEGGTEMVSIVFYPSSHRPVWTDPEPHVYHPEWVFQYYTHCRRIDEDGNRVYDPIMPSYNQSVHGDEMYKYFSDGDYNFFAVWGVHYKYSVYDATMKAVGAGGRIKANNGTPKTSDDVIDTEFGKIENSDVKLTAVPDKGYRFVGWKCVKASDSAQESLDSADYGFVSTDITYNYVPENGSETDSDNTDTLYALFEEAPEADENSSTAKVSGTLVAKAAAKGKNSLMLSWTKVKGVKGYDVFLGKNKKAKKVKTIKGNTKFKWVKSKLKTKTPYKVQIKAWVKQNGKKVYVKKSPAVYVYTFGGTKAYTNAKGLTVNKTAVSLKAGKTFKIKATVKKLKTGKKLMPKTFAPKLRYLSSKTKVATVSSSGKIKARSKGDCYVYVFTHNGISKKIKVTVK